MALPIFKWWRRWRGRAFVRRLTRMLSDLDARLKRADFNRHERRRLKRNILKDIAVAVEMFKKWEV